MISELLRAQSALGHGVALLDRNAVVYSNEALATLCGVAVADFCDRSTLLEAIDVTMRAQVAQLLDERGRSGVDRMRSVIVRDGHNVTVEVSALELLVRGRPLTYVLVRPSETDVARGNGQSSADNLDRWRRKAFLSEASELLASTINEKRFVTSVAQLAVPRFADWCMVEVDEGGRDLQLVASVHRRHDLAWLADELKRRRPNDGGSPFSVSEVLRSGRGVLLRDVDAAISDSRTLDPEDLRIYYSLGVRSAMIVPLLAAGTVLGVMRFFALDRRRRFSGADLEAAEELAHRVGMAYQHSKLQRRTSEAVRWRDELLTIASHELRTPLSALQLSVQVLAQEIGSGADLDREAIAARLARVFRQSQRLSLLIDELLDVSHVTAGKVWLTCGPVDLREVVGSVVDGLRNDATAAECRLVFRSSGVVRGNWDESRIRQIVGNLVGNAIRYAPGTAIDVRLTSNDAQAVLVVRDRGPGIPESDSQRVFERFERGADDKPAGFGLGLYLCRKLVEAHGGGIELESQPGHGCTFTITLPCDGVADDQLRSNASP